MSSRLSKFLGTDTKKPPGKSEDEKALDALELQSLSRQAEVQEMLFPFILQSMGLEQYTDESGNAGIRESQSVVDPRMLALDETNFQIQEAAAQQTLAGLQGKLDIDPSVEADIERGKAQLREELFRKLGPGAEGSDAWNRAFSEYDRSSNALRYGLRHGQMTTADAISTNRTNIQDRRQAQQFSQLSQATNPYLVTADSVASGANRMSNERWRISDLDERNARTRRAVVGDAISAGATIMGASAFGGAKPPTGG